MPRGRAGEQPAKYEFFVSIFERLFVMAEPHFLTCLEQPARYQRFMSMREQFALDLHFSVIERLLQHSIHRGLAEIKSFFASQAKLSSDFHHLRQCPCASGVFFKNARDDRCADFIHLDNTFAEFIAGIQVAQRRGSRPFPDTSLMLKASLDVFAHGIGVGLREQYPHAPHGTVAGTRIFVNDRVLTEKVQFDRAALHEVIEQREFAEAALQAIHLVGDDSNRFFVASGVSDHFHEAFAITAC